MTSKQHRGSGLDNDGDDQSSEPDAAATPADRKRGHRAKRSRNDGDMDSSSSTAKSWPVFTKAELSARIAQDVKGQPRTVRLLTNFLLGASQFKVVNGATKNIRVLHLAGASGTGKTNTADIMAAVSGIETDRGDPCYIRYEANTMNEAAFALSGILGSGPGYEGHEKYATLVKRLGDAIALAERRRKSSKVKVDRNTCRSPYVINNVRPCNQPHRWTYCGFAHVLIFVDELDKTKASLKIFESLMTLMSEGRMQSTDGETIVIPDGLCVMIVLASNFGTQMLAQMPQPPKAVEDDHGVFQDKIVVENAVSAIQQDMTRRFQYADFHFSRISMTIPFYELNGDMICDIVQLSIQNIYPDYHLDFDASRILINPFITPRDNRDTHRETIRTIVGEAASQLEREITEADLYSEALQRFRQYANDPNWIDCTYSVVIYLQDVLEDESLRGKPCP